MSAANRKTTEQLREAVAAFQSGQLEKASRLFKTAASTKGAGPQAAFNYAIFLKQTGQYSQAAYWFDRCLRAAPDYPGASAERARLHLLAGEWRKAAALLETTTSDQHADLDVRLLGLQALLECGELDAAENLAEELAAQNPTLRPLIMKAKTRRSKGRLTLLEKV